MLLSMLTKLLCLSLKEVATDGFILQTAERFQLFFTARLFFVLCACLSVS